MYVFFFQAEDGIRDGTVTGVQTCALPICGHAGLRPLRTGFRHGVHRPGHRRGARVHGGSGPRSAVPRGRAIDHHRRDSRVTEPGRSSSRPPSARAGLASPAPMDPVTLEICWNRLVGVVNEQATALQRTSFTSIVREAGDLSAGVFDRRGYMVAQAVTGTPGHINSMALAMKHFLAAYPLETLRPGDVLITNDPWLTSGHLNDVTICSPIFRGKECIAFFASTYHTADIGGHVLSAEAREVYEEGLQIPIMKLYDAGRPNDALMAIIRENTRLPDMVLGDFHAQIAGGAVGGERLLEFMTEFGLEHLEPLADEIIGRTERAMRQAIRALKPGVYTNAVISDGFDEPITIRVRC